MKIREIISKASIVVGRKNEEISAFEIVGYFDRKRVFNLNRFTIPAGQDL